MVKMNYRFLGKKNDDTQHALLKTIETLKVKRSCGNKISAPIMLL